MLDGIHLSIYLRSLVLKEHRQSDANNLRCDTVTRGKCYQYQIFPTSAGMKKTFLPDGQVVRHINISKDEGIGIYMRIYGSKEELDLS